MEDKDILLELHRQYSKDEFVKLLIQEHKAEHASLKQTIGEQTSYIQELEDKLKEVSATTVKGLKNEIKALNKQITLLKQDASVPFKDKITALDKKIKEQQKTINDLIAKLMKADRDI